MPNKFEQPGTPEEGIEVEQEDTSEQDPERARAVAEAGDKHRTREAYATQVGKILERLENDKNFTREDAEEALIELSSRYPGLEEDPELELSTWGGFERDASYYKTTAEFEAEDAERVEHWAEVLHDHPVEGWTTKDLRELETSASNQEFEADEAQKQADKIEQGITKNGFRGGVNFDYFRAHTIYNPDQLDDWIERVNEAEKRYQELSMNPDTTIGELSAVILNMLRDEARALRSQAAKTREQLRQFEEGTYQSEEQEAGRQES